MPLTLPQNLPSPGRFLYWGLNHADLMIAWGNAGPELIAADSFSDRWLVIRPLGDITAPALDELFSDAPTPRGELSATEIRELEDELLAKINSTRAIGEKRDRKWLKAALQALKIGLPMFVPEAAQWVQLLDLLGN